MASRDPASVVMMWFTPHSLIVISFKIGWAVMGMPFMAL